MSTANPTARKPSRIQVVLSLLTVSVAVVAHLVAQAGMLFTRPEWTLSSFRAYFPYDQLSYMSMVRNVAEGQYDGFEPFTETGANFYPRGWYIVLGTVARIFDLHPATVWQTGGLAIQGVMVAAVAVTIILLTRRPLLGLLAPLPFVLGTFAVLRGGEWFTSMSSHAVLWGPFGVLFTVNGEAASLSIAATALMLLLAVWARGASTRARLAATVVAAALVGLLANVQTYSFITAVYLIVIVASTWALLRYRSRVGAIAAAVLVPVLFFVGPVVFATFGQLPTLVFGLLPALPGFILLLRHHTSVTLLASVAAVLAASPQVIATAVGIATEDPFLTYRVASNRDLGVDALPGLTGALPVAVTLVALVMAGLVLRDRLAVAFGIGSAAAWLVLATNDVWGPNAEPYRLWIDSFLLIAVGALPLVARAAVVLLSRRAYAVAPADSPDAAPAAIPVRRRPARAVTIGVLAALVVTAGVSTADWVRFWQADAYHGLWSFTDETASAQTELAEYVRDHDDGTLLAVDSCVDPQVVKLNSGVPVAHYALGMAWPGDRDAVQSFLTDRTAGAFDAQTARAAGVGWMLVDTQCPTDWPALIADQMTLVTSSELAGGRYQLWRMQ